MRSEELSKKWWYRLLQVIFVAVLLFLFCFILLIKWEDKPFRTVDYSKSYIHCEAEPSGFDYRLSDFPYYFSDNVSESIELGPLPTQHDLYARNLCRFQTIRDYVYKQRSVGTSGVDILNDIRKFAAPEGQKYIDGKIKNNDVEAALDEIIKAYTITNQNYDKNVGDGPRTKYAYHQEILQTGSYFKWIFSILGWFFGATILLLIVRKIFLYILIGKQNSRS